MSGGHFNYDQYKIGYIADSIEQLIEKNGRKKTPEEMKGEGWRDPNWYEKYPEDRYYYSYPDEVIEKFKEAVILLRKAQIYAHRIDWLVSGDDGNDSFINRLEKELKNFEYVNQEQKEMTYEERIRWFLENYYETGMEYEILLETMKNENLDSFQWYDKTVSIPRFVK